MESWKLSIQLVVEEYNRENMERDSEQKLRQEEFSYFDEEIRGQLQQLSSQVKELETFLSVEGSVVEECSQPPNLESTELSNKGFSKQEKRNESLVSEKSNISTDKMTEKELTVKEKQSVDTRPEIIKLNPVKVEVQHKIIEPSV